LNRIKDDYDGAEPSGNSVALMNLLRLHRITGREDLLASARNLISAFSTRVAASPFGMPQVLAACEFDLRPAKRDYSRGNTRTRDDPPALEEVRPQPRAAAGRAGIAGFHPEVLELARGPAAVCLCENFACQDARDERGRSRAAARIGVSTKGFPKAKTGDLIWNAQERQH
jgi:uncharacterized protein YyaL (SSP411 family)